MRFIQYNLQRPAGRAFFVTAVMLATLFGNLRAVAQVQKPFWDLNELGNAPTWSALESPASSSAQVKAIFFTGLSFKGKTNRVFAWLGIPKVKPGEKVPGIVLVHGGGGTAFEEWVRLWVDRGYAAIAMDTCGQVPVGTYGHWVKDDQGGPPGWGGFQQMDWDPKDQWTYQAVADIVLAHSLLRSLPEVDAERTGLTGISWGGYLTCIAAGVDNRFKFAVPVYGCGFYPDAVFSDALGKLDAEQRDRWMSWWDPSVYLGAAKMPMLWVDGSNDHFYYLNAVQRSYRLPPGPRSLCVRLRMPHGQGEGEKPPEIQCFADSILKDGIPLPTITGQGREGTNVWATFIAKVKVTKAELNYTKDTGNWEKRKWETLPAKLLGNRFTAALPAETRVYYLNLTDERGCMVSAEHEECESF
ncbi:MAG: acetylxylan esterase [Verrucomicrobiota bacterium]